MENNNSRANHELDLDLISEFGFLDNSEVSLSELEFVTDRKVQAISDITWDFFDKMGKPRLLLTIGAV